MTEDDKIQGLVLRLAEIAEETQQPGYHGHAAIPRFFEEVRKFTQEVKRDCNGNHQEPEN